MRSISSLCVACIFVQYILSYIPCLCKLTQWISFPCWRQFVSKSVIKKQAGSLSFKGLSQDGRWTDFSENLCASLFNDDLSNVSTFSQIHLAGQ
jgi:hypothetical protein